MQLSTLTLGETKLQPILKKSGLMDKLIDDELLVAQFQAGRQNAFDELMKRYKSKIFSYLLRSVRNYEDAEDITIEVFFKAYRALEGWQPKAKFSTWLYKIASNLAIDYHRAKARRPVYALDDTEIPETHLVATDLHSDPEKQLEEKERGILIREAVDQLSPKQKAVFMLSRYEGLQLKEVAETLDMAEGTVKIHLHRAVKRLQTLLRPLWENNEI
ncbi:sigma-70 family RNA polymerase sigma factor [Candidatus Poribacteria bacterium]|nr:sigma-70 family RNA polymerase sigma factor [Candidatus Poribacteria bacterium]MYA99483.1 sigma-70 family RNA polymerase sigma factor [Candidatus Poribacteria bacterium]